MTQVISLTTFAESASADEWHDIADLFVECFSSAPYFEEPSELRTIVERWSFDEIGQVPMSGDAIALRVLTAPTSRVSKTLTE